MVLEMIHHPRKRHGHYESINDDGRVVRREYRHSWEVAEKLRRVQAGQEPGLPVHVLVVVLGAQFCGDRLGLTSLRFGVWSQFADLRQQLTSGRNGVRILIRSVMNCTLLYMYWYSTV